MVSRKIKFLLPKDRGELIPMFFVMFIITIYVIFELSVILPTIYHNIFTYKEILHLIFGSFIIFNLLGNLYSCLLTDTSIDTIICPVMLPTPMANLSERDANDQHCNWHYCHRCEVNAPPRAEHCYLCRKCILKHDHHCTLLGRCIGYRNIRYYFCFLIWSWIGLLYCNILHMDYMYELVGSLSWRFLIACLFPLGAWFFNLLDHFSLILSSICSTSIILCIYVSVIIVQQIFLIINSQTWHEYKRNIHLFDIGRNFPSNMQMVFGKRWYWVLLTPLVVSSPMGDGMTFDMNIPRVGAKHN